MANKLVHDDMHNTYVRKYWDRFLKMDSARNAWEAEWHYSDIQTEATVSTDSQGKMIVNVPIEKVLLDINDGKYAQPIPFDIV